MKEKGRSEQKFCGNCGSHNAYNYPSQVFCTNRFLKNMDSVVDTLWHCEDWHLNPQGCHCIENAEKMKKR